MKQWKKALCLFIAAVVCTCTACDGSSKTKKQTAHEVKFWDGEPDVSGTFHFSTLFGTIENEEKFFYSDQYFSNPGTYSDPHLKTLSLGLAASVTPAVGGEKDRYVRNFLDQLQFEDYQSDDLVEKPTTESIGTAMAHRKTPYGEVIVIALRGEGYEAEWESNMEIGREGDVYGFQQASEKVLQRIRDYREKYDLENAKIWFAGFSRGGAVANLAGKYINEHLEEYGIGKEDLYVYTFESPNSSSDPVCYENIHNSFNRNDLVNYLPFQEWGLCNNGVTEKTGEDEWIEKKEFRILGGFGIVSVYQKDEDGFSTDEVFRVTKEEFLTEFNAWISGIVSREEAADNLAAIGKLFGLIYEKTTDDILKTVNYYRLVGKELINDETIDKTKFLLNFAKKSSDGDYQDEDYQQETREMAEMVIRAVDRAYDERPDLIPERDYQVIREAVFPILVTFRPLIAEDAMNFEHLATFGYYAKDLLLEHFTDENLEELKKMDSYYQ